MDKDNIVRNSNLFVADDKQLIDEYRNGNTEMLDILIEKNYRFISSIARHYANNGIEIEDLIQEGNLGLVEAVEKYDYQKGTKFTTYAYYWIKLYIERAIIKMGKSIRLPEYLFREMCSFRRNKNNLELKLGRSVTAYELAAYLNIPIEKATILYESQYEPKSMNKIVNESAEMGDFISSNDMSPEEIVIEEMMQSDINELLNNGYLSLRESEIIKYRFGLDGREILSLVKIGKKFGISNERIRQIELMALKKLYFLAKSKDMGVYLGKEKTYRK